jgi:hypothetical protein
MAALSHKLRHPLLSKSDTRAVEPILRGRVARWNTRQSRDDEVPARQICVGRSKRNGVLLHPCTCIVLGSEPRGHLLDEL